MAEFTHKGKKKECVAQCALEACRILDRNGLLRQAKHEPRKRKVEKSDDDDDDEFYDRTAGAEEKRKRKAGSDESVALSYDQLVSFCHILILIRKFYIHFYFVFDFCSWWKSKNCKHNWWKLSSELNDINNSKRHQKRKKPWM